ncbi:lipoprotein [Roseibium algae]|uniref:Lipoprotein n=1 Tax=Roseibium algae TaxID=3123038 RepID=A0ABU8TR47_9HYPH
MKKFILAACAALALTACQTTSPYSTDNKPQIVTTKTVSEAKSAAKAIFTRPTLAFRVVRETPNTLLLRKSLPANVNDTNPLKDRTKGRPDAVIKLVFTPDNGATRVTGDNWIVLNPGHPNKDTYNLLDTPDGSRLKNKMYEIR